MSHDSNRTRIWFPMFSYFESSVDGIIPNEYDSIENVLINSFSWIAYIKDCCMLTARRFWIAHNHLTPLPPKNLRPNSMNNSHLNNSVINNASGLKIVNSKGNGKVLITNNEIKHMEHLDKLISDDIKQLLKKDI